MMKQLFLLMIVTLSISCSNQEATNKETQQTSIIIYGSNSCDHCIDFKAKLDAKNIKYTFHDVEQDKTMANEMMAKTKAHNYTGYISFPVVDVGGKLMVNPEVNKVLELL
ncbi:MAG: glutaredoxin family protein [Cyclobacteriaceae bacterium]|nr:glutaredoxin family protein [Cyclobacteriaceae bacterium]